MFGLIKQQLRYLVRDDWYSLPEMTQVAGEFCYDSCRAQAWSIATILHALEMLE